MNEANGKVFIDPKQLTSYGDATNDGAVQLSFTLPIPHGLWRRKRRKNSCRTSGSTSPRSSRWKI